MSEIGASSRCRLFMIEVFLSASRCRANHPAQARWVVKARPRTPRLKVPPPLRASPLPGMSPTAQRTGAGDGPAEVENAVVIARRPADEHVLQHLLDSP